MKSKPSSDNGIGQARNRVNQLKDDLVKLNDEFEDAKIARKEKIDCLQRELGQCRNGVERELIHRRIEHERGETTAIYSIFRQSINTLESELSDAASDLRVTVNDLYYNEFDKFKRALPLQDDVYRAYVAHSFTFEGGDWEDFLRALYPAPSSFELEDLIEELKEDMYGAL